MDQVEEAILLATSAPQLLTPVQVAELLGVQPRTIERWRRTGEGPSYVQLSRRTIRYTDEAVRVFIAGNLKHNTGQ
jgi:predicted site-specific integrase-resolvase